MIPGFEFPTATTRRTRRNIAFPGIGLYAPAFGKQGKRGVRRVVAVKNKILTTDHPAKKMNLVFSVMHLSHLVLIYVMPIIFYFYR